MSCPVIGQLMLFLLLPPPQLTQKRTVDSQNRTATNPSKTLTN